LGFEFNKKVKYYFYNEKGSSTIITDNDMKILNEAFKNIEGIISLKIEKGKIRIEFNPLKTDNTVFENTLEKLGFRIIYSDTSY